MKGKTSLRLKFEESAFGVQETAISLRIRRPSRVVWKNFPVRFLHDRPNTLGLRPSTISARLVLTPWIQRRTCHQTGCFRTSPSRSRCFRPLGWRPSLRPPATSCCAGVESLERCLLQRSAVRAPTNSRGEYSVQRLPLLRVS